MNAVYANKIEAIADEAERAAYVDDRRREYEQDVDLERLVSDLVLDGIVEPEALREELIHRYRYAVGTRPLVQCAPARRAAGLRSGGPVRRHDGGVSDDELAVLRGGAAAEDVAAVVAVLAALGETSSESAESAGYAAWRRTRLAALAVRPT